MLGLKVGLAKEVRQRGGVGNVKIKIMRNTSLKGLISSPLTKKGPCWKGYEAIGMKKKGGRTVPNCVPKKKK